MAMITRALFAIVRATTYPSMLAAGGGGLATRSGYAEAFGRLDADFRLPWQNDDGEVVWSEFWARYLGKPERLRSLSADTAWERVVPLRWAHGATIEHPSGATADAEVLVYPGAIAVVLRVDATGDWPLERLGAELGRLRESRDWTLRIDGETSANRDLEGIATSLRDQAAKLLRPGNPPEPGATETFVLAAPAGAKGTRDALDLRQEAVRSAVAGLAVLGPPGTFADARLLEANSDTNHAARVYVVGGGHAIWHADNALEPPEDDAVACLHRNHARAVAQVAALAGIVRWAADALRNGRPVPLSLQPLAKRAADRLALLHAGTKERTYRAGVAKLRIEPLLGDVRAVQQAF